MILNTNHGNMLVSPARSLVGKVELFKGSTLTRTFLHSDVLNSFTVDRAGDKKFFGFGVCQELELVLLDRERAINIAEDDILKVSFGVNDDYVYPTPPFYVSSDISRDENTNDLTIKAYDALYKAKNHTVSELALTAPYTIGDMANAIASFLGLAAIVKLNITDTSFNTNYPEGANFEGTETLREALDDIAEATQTIYYVNSDNNLIFKRLNKNGEAVLTITRADYFTLSSKTNYILSDICRATELGDNVIISAPGIEGKIQYVRDNAFWDLRDDIAILLDAAIIAAGGLSINQFTCNWRGNYLVEPGDKIGLITKDGGTVISYLLNDKYTYNGGLSAETLWEGAEEESENANPSNIGEAIKQTYAKVDKVNKEIELVASEIGKNDSTISQLLLDTESIKASVQEVSQITDDAIQNLNQSTEDSFNSINENITTLTQEVNTKMTANDVSISIQTALEQGVESITTTTGFTFNEEGLHISKTGTEITTTITEDGMTVYRENDEVLVADNLGVRAEDLHATTYLIIGVNSRIEDYDDNARTGCFWIGL